MERKAVLSLPSMLSMSEYSLMEQAALPNERVRTGSPVLFPGVPEALK
jgi:hypothetical protein